MGKIKQFFKDERGIMVTTEAVFLYPFTIFVIFTMIYAGLFMFQGVLLQNYAQKIAVTASRAVAYPNYTTLSSGVETVFGDTSVDWKPGTAVNYPYTSVSGLTVYPYRYLTSINFSGNSDILGSAKTSLEAAAQNMVENGSILKGMDVSISIDVSNYFISQQVEVSISENFTILKFAEALGFGGNTLSATASATANDPDEFIRNVDLVFDIGDGLAKKMGISDDLSKLGEKIRDIIAKLGWNKT